MFPELLIAGGAIIILALVLLVGLVPKRRARKPDIDSFSTGTATATKAPPARDTADVAVDEGAVAAPPGAEMPPPETVDTEPEQATPMSVRERFRTRLGRSRSSLGTSVTSIFRRGVDDDAWDDLEESLIAADVGVDATMEIVEGLRQRAKEEGIRTGDQALALLKEVLLLELSVADRTLHRREDG